MLAIDVEELFKTGTHFAYSKSKRHPKMKPFIFAAKNNTEIFDLEKTKSRLEAARDFIKSLAKDGKTILFVGTKKEAKGIVEKMANELEMPYVAERWLGGILSNYKEIKNRIDYLNEFEEKERTGGFEKYTKKERLQMERKIKNLKRYLLGLKELKNYPSALIVVDSNREKIAVAEAKKMGLPVIAIMNSDCNPDDVVFPIPANDSSISSIQYLMSELTRAYKEEVTASQQQATSDKRQVIIN